MVTVERFDYPERTRHYKSGASKTMPSYYECYYYYDGKEIAQYTSRDDVIYLNTKYIDRDRNKKDYERALAGVYKDAYAYLFAMLGVDETSKVSEYMNM